MFWSVLSSKGGMGTSVVAAGLARTLSSRTRQRVVLLDFGGDQSDIFGTDVADRPGMVDWLQSSNDVGVDAISNLEIEVFDGLSIIPRGTTSLPAAGRSVDVERCTSFVREMSNDAFVVCDLGVVPADPVSPHALIAAASDRTIAVLRPCYLALRRATRLPILINDVVEVVEPGRSLSTLDIESVTGVPVCSRLRIDPAIARTIDAGLLPRRVPRALRRTIDDVLASGPSIDLGASVKTSFAGLRR